MSSFRYQRGLSHIEQVVAAGLIAWIAYVTFPATGAYTGRHEGVEPYYATQQIREAVSSYIKKEGRCPAGGLTTPTPAGLGLVQAPTGQFIDRVELTSNCVIRTTYGGDARPELKGKVFASYAGVDANGKIHWVCGTADAPDLGPSPHIPFAAGPTDTTANYAPWLPTSCHKPRSMTERKPSLILWIEQQGGA